MIDRPLDGLGASDAAAILGVSRWRSALDVFNDKMGITTNDKKEEHQEWGLLLEPALAGRYSQITGRRLRRIGIVRSKHHPLLYAHPDRMVVGEPGLVEIKVSRNAWDEVPIYYKTQAIQQMLCSGREWVDFAVLVYGQRFLLPIPRVERDRSIEADFAAELEEWWERHIVRREPPEMDGGDGGRQYLRKVHPAGDGNEIVATTEMLKTIDRYRLAKVNLDQIVQDEARLKQEVQTLIGDNSAIVGPFGKIMWTRFTAAKVDWKGVAIDLERYIRGEADDKGRSVDKDIEFIKGMHTTPVQSSRFTPQWKEEEDD